MQLINITRYNKEGKKKQNNMKKMKLMPTEHLNGRIKSKVITKLVTILNQVHIKKQKVSRK